MPNLNLSARGEHSQGECLRQHHRLGYQQRSSAVDPIGKHTGDGREQQYRDVLTKRDDTKQQRRAREAIGEP